MCSGGDAVKMFANHWVTIASKTLKGGRDAIVPQQPQMPDVVRTDPVADQAKTSADAAQEAQNARLLQRRASRRNSLLSNAGAAGDTSVADVSTPTVYGKTNLGA